ncbi:hypothetical protein BKA82DRAFT_320190 [Pisolithus tinctorius]|uniref:Uncharacterized protein n=1 Tax=Pisolithus tinctorius Marx 270 TaxID=870435 RepID=A0A0C3NIY9_PISTI|nr:hypothetical protein BKA82DRAFT_320190 [Pisolithus tinctorius]KIN95333.1 hypothetical protein M404DRAFT_320190 [Pisolithus tinctorius Marx 270]
MPSLSDSRAVLLLSLWQCQPSPISPAPIGLRTQKQRVHRSLSSSTATPLLRRRTERRRLEHPQPQRMSLGRIWEEYDTKKHARTVIGKPQGAHLKSIGISIFSYVFRSWGERVWRWGFHYSVCSLACPAEKARNA